MESIGDLFCHTVEDGIVSEIIKKLVKVCNEHTLIFLTKNPSRYKDFMDLFTENCVLGTTIETDIYPKDFNPNVPSKMV